MRKNRGEESVSGSSLLLYKEDSVFWRNLSAVISRARAAFEVSGHIIADHFVDVTEMVDLERNSLCFSIYCLTFVSKRVSYTCSKKLKLLSRVAEGLAL